MGSSCRRQELCLIALWPKEFVHSTLGERAPGNKPGFEVELGG